MGSSGVLPDEKVEDLLEDRRLYNDFRWASRTWTQSPYFVRGQLKDPKELIQLVLASEKVLQAVKEVSQKTGKSEKEVMKQAQGIMNEMAHDFHMYAIRWFGLTLSKLGKRLYNCIQVNVEKLNQIKEAYKSYPVIILPTHRSYVDFLLISYMSFHYELSLPIIAAGMDFLGMAGVGEMLRKSGAFYIRRQFGGDVLYWALISEYVKKAVIEGGHPLEMFVEGTRSRSGKSIKPKIGLLSAILELVASSEIPDILLLPISMSYDRTLEEHLYAHELLGKPKPRESTNGLMKALRWLGSQSYGSVYVNFGELISVRSLLRRDLNLHLVDESSIFRKGVEELAMLAVLEHQKNLVIPIFPAVSIAILAKIARNASPMNLKELLTNLEYFQLILNSRNSRFGYPLRGDDLETNVRHILSVHSLLVSIPNSGSAKSSDEVAINIQPGDLLVQSMIFQHYANQCLPAILPFCIMCTLHNSQLEDEESERVRTESVCSESETPVFFKASEENVEDYVFLRQLLGDDFVYQSGNEVHEFHVTMDVLNFMGKSHLQRNDSRKRKGSLNDFYRILILALEPYLIAYWGMTMTLLEVSERRSESPYEMKQLGKMCQDFIHQKMRAHLPKQYGALSLDTLANAALSLVRSQSAARVKLENGSYGIVVQQSQRLSSIRARLEKLLGLDRFLLNMERHSINPNTELDGSRISPANAKNKENHGEQIQLRSKL